MLYIPSIMRHVILLGLASAVVFVTGCASDSPSTASKAESSPSAKSQANSWIYDTPDAQGKPAATTAATQPAATAPATTAPATTTSTPANTPVIATQPAAVAASGQTYTVQSGDSLWKIARTHGTTVDKIKALNNLNSDVIRVGLQLKLPAN